MRRERKGLVTFFFFFFYGCIYRISMQLVIVPFRLVRTYADTEMDERRNRSRDIFIYDILQEEFFHQNKSIEKKKKKKNSSMTISFYPFVHRD